MTASSQNHEFYLIFAKQYTISDTLKSMFEYVAKHQAQGDVVQFFWARTPLKCGDTDDLEKQCLESFGTNKLMHQNAFPLNIRPDQTYVGIGIQGTTEYYVQLIALITRTPVTRPSSLERPKLRSIPENTFAPDSILNAARKRPSPSTGAAVTSFMKYQKAECADAAYDSRPFALRPSPISIYDPTLAQFSRHITHPTSQYTFSKEELARAKAFATISMAWYASESERQSDLEPFINIGDSPMFRSVVIPLDDGASMTVDGGISVPHDGQIFRLVFTEVKNGAGTALNQVELYYMKLVSSARYWRVWQVSCCPMILIVVIGDTISVWGAVFADRFMFEPLCSIQLGPSPNIRTISELPSDWLSTRRPAASTDSNPPAQQSPPPQQSHPAGPVLEDRWDAGVRDLAKLLRCLDHAVVDLMRYYTGLQLPAQSSNPQTSSRGQKSFSTPSSTTSQPSTSPAQARFPFWTSFTSDDGFKYDLVYLARLTDDISKPVFRARMTASSGGNPVDVVVKFAFSYGEKGHKLLADRDSAPTLLYCKYERDIGMWAIVMELLAGGSLEAGSYLTDGQRKSLQAALDALHEEKLVFGDLREPNIIASGDRVKLIDFDWCGEEGVVRYPATTNTTGEIKWHSQVCGGQLIFRSHDTFRLEVMSGKLV